MSAFVLEITGHLFTVIFESPLFEVLAVTFLFVVGLSTFNMVKKSI